MSKLLHAEELARIAGVHKSTILLAIRRGELHASRTVGRSARITPEDAQTYLAARGKTLPPELDVGAQRASLAVLSESADVTALVRGAVSADVDLVGGGSLYRALVAVGARLPTVVVVDLDMVFMNPISLIRALRSTVSLRTAHIAALGLRDDLFGAARAAGASDVLLKLDARGVAEALARLTGRAALAD